MAHQAGTYPSFRSVKQLEVFLLPPGWDSGPIHRVNPGIKFTDIHLYTRVDRDTVRIKNLAQEHNAMCLAGLKSRLLNPETSTLTLSSLILPPSLYLPQFTMQGNSKKG